MSRWGSKGVGMSSLLGMWSGVGLACPAGCGHVCVWGVTWGTRWRGIAVG